MLCVQAIWKEWKIVEREREIKNALQKLCKDPFDPFKKKTNAKMTADNQQPFHWPDR